jgi:mono/diheme cytochrome c family protein
MTGNVDPDNKPPASGTDPVTGTSLSGPLLVGSLLLCLALVWALYDEAIGQRPWKSYQTQFRARYTAHLKSQRPRAASAEQAVYASPEFRDIDHQLNAAEQAAAPRLKDITLRLDVVRARLDAIKDPLQDARARIAALVYDLDHSTSPGRRHAIQQQIDRIRKEPFRVDAERDTFDQLEGRFKELRASEAQLVAEETGIAKTAADLRRRRSEYLANQTEGLNQQQIDSVLRKMETFRIDIRQIHVPEAGLVDRCESCHLGIREPLTLTAADMGNKPVFASHPGRALLAVHDPERFGCSLCHNGNGSATSSVEKAHGTNRDWPWPLFAKEDREAGCLQCHRADRVLELAPVLTRGRDLYQMKGCVGCHRYEGFDREVDGLAETRQAIRSLEQRATDDRLDIDREIKRGNSAAGNDEARQHYARAENLRVTISNLDARLAELGQKARFLMQDQKDVGPNLKDVRLKLRKEWIPVWLNDPQAFRPGTKMPHFRLSADERRAVAAFVWQSGLDGPSPPSQPKGDPVNGQALFETRGCLGCHSIGEGDNRVGGVFAANLSRLGEKADYDYIVRWVHNPRERTRPYCAREKRDLGPDDYTRHGLPFVFDLQHSTCPNDGSLLQVQNLTVMPVFRLSWVDARDIASYLTSLRHAGTSYPTDVSYMDDPRLADTGRGLVSRYGCGNCHEIRGFENVSRVGTELTKEASKPIEQLDFGLLERRARQEGWYSPKGFFEHKLTESAVYDRGRQKAAEERLRMPDIQLSAADVVALTTVLVGSLDSPSQAALRTIPSSFRYEPKGPQKDLQDGWWIVKKYNCMGCHDIQVGQKSSLSALTRHQDPDWKEKLPPALLEEGARVNPEWLARFLANPSLNETDARGNAVRTYLQVRMPTFNLSPNEIGVLVRFFGALAGQAVPYIPQRLEPLDEREWQMARTLFVSRGAACLKCHLTGVPRHDRLATAPNFLIAAERLKPDWTARWMTDPQNISPGTAMPSGLFHHEGGRWVFAGKTPDTFRGYTKDHVQLLVRYMFQLTPEEQRRLIQMVPVVIAEPPSAHPRGDRRP